MDSLPKGVIISHVDFAEIYFFQPFNEIQTKYYYSFQVTILVQITFCNNPNYKDDKDEPCILKEAHIYISNDKGHDTLFV